LRSIVDAAAGGDSIIIIDGDDETLVEEEKDAYCRQGCLFHDTNWLSLPKARRSSEGEKALLQC